MSEPALGGFLPEGAFSKDARGSVGAVFLKNISSPKFYSLGQSGSAMPSPESFFFNPGASYCEKKNCLYASYQSLYEGAYSNELAWTLSREKGFYSFAFQSMGYGSFDKLNSRAEKIGSFSPSDKAFIFSKTSAGGKFNWGFNLKIAQSDLIYEKGWTAALDAGLLSMPVTPNEASYSIYMRNFGNPVKIGGKSFPLPFELGVGMAKPYSFFDLYAEGKFPSYDNPYLTAGLSLPLFYSKTSEAQARIGFNPKNKKYLGWGSAVSGGFGFRIGALTADYAYAPYGDMGDTHRFSISWRFNEKENGFQNRDSFRYETLSRIYMKNRFFASVPLANYAVSDYPNLGLIFSREIQYCILESGYKIPDDDPSVYSEAEKNLPYNPQEFCRVLAADYCIYGRIDSGKKKLSYEITVYDMNKKEEIKKFVLESPSSYDFKRAARQACSYILSD